MFCLLRSGTINYNVWFKKLVQMMSTATIPNELQANALRYDGFYPTIGLEVHAQINSESKLFSRSSTNYSSGPNENVNCFDAAHPGTLPVINQSCVDAAIKTALTLNCEVNKKSNFDRKHYFYHDMPANYQITQHHNPIARHGGIEYIVYDERIIRNAYIKTTNLIQIQLEQDSGKSLNDTKGHRTLFDLNRAGVGLMELVFEPNLINGEEALCLVNELINNLKLINTCTCKLNEGTLRVDANISVRRNFDDQLSDFRTEVKNLNSLNSIRNAIDYEIRRQIKLIKSGNGQIRTETMTYDAERKVTVPMREKNTEVKEYRFYFEPNLPPLLIDDNEINSIKDCLPKLINQQRTELIATYKELRLDEIKWLIDNQDYLHLFNDCIKIKSDLNYRILYDFLSNELDDLLEEHKLRLKQSALDAQLLTDLIHLISINQLTTDHATEVCRLIVQGEKFHLQQLIEQKQWKRINDHNEIEKFVKHAIQAAPTISKQYAKKGKRFQLEKLLNTVRNESNMNVDKHDAKIVLDKILKPPIEPL